MGEWKQGLPQENGWYAEERDPSHTHPCEVYEGHLYVIGSESPNGHLPTYMTPERLARTWFYGPLERPPRRASSG